MKELMREIEACNICWQGLPLGPNPVLQVSPKSKIIIVGQAPGIRVHQSGIPWNDPSGDNLRNWLNVSSEEFYNPDIFGIIPMGFCYPGTGKSGDLPPRKECARTWHKKLFKQIESPELVLLVGKYAIQYYLKTKENLTETVKNFAQEDSIYFPLPHPSPRNNIWQKKNPWFKTRVIPNLQEKIREFI
ncbi:uracil-DNA glycosylase family protein [Luteibaculum oceani]|uniref:Uracil-DNA glycosylase family protein n=1 Tax=Luteibaculum oceani TaxID=1294296 RepID=A0A5C6V015_9FLAO|nr:uracil-DNA glycosylase family protein [Luteibaculum oceani]TXC76255.1 uracil-DNA glycosylase family protein [Luteibaculum oceani]